MRAILPGRLLITAKVEPGFMHQGRGLEGVTWRFAGHLVRRHSPQFVIDQRQQLMRGWRVALFDGLEDLRDVTHAVNRSRADRKSESPKIVIVRARDAAQSPNPSVPAFQKPNRGQRKRALRKLPRQLGTQRRRFAHDALAFRPAR